VQIPEGFVEIKNCPKWFINFKGDVWSAFNGGVLRPHQNGSGGYMQLIYGSRENRKKHYIHRLVVETFIGSIPEGYCVNHIDGVKTNNDVKNLEIVTRKENNDHAVKQGLRKKWRGQLHPQSKLTEADVLAIRRKKASGTKTSILAEEFKVRAQTITEIARRSSWSWLD
jgi:hypothetical protein